MAYIIKTNAGNRSMIFKSDVLHSDAVQLVKKMFGASARIVL